jgi:hypothetical protein
MFNEITHILSTNQLLKHGDFVDMLVAMLTYHVVMMSSFSFLTSTKPTVIYDWVSF